MGKLFFIIDTHFGHTDIIRYYSRPFNNAVEMDKYMVEMWNKQVSQEDYVIHLGDFGVAPVKYLQEVGNKLNGYKVLVTGNHDIEFTQAFQKDVVS